MVLNTRKRLQFMIIIVNSDLIERRDVIFICSNDSWSAADVCRMQQLSDIIPEKWFHERHCAKESRRPRA